MATCCPFCHSLATVTRTPARASAKGPMYRCALCDKSWHEPVGPQAAAPDSAIVWAGLRANPKVRGAKKPTGARRQT